MAQQTRPIEAVVQQVIDIPELEPFYHSDLPGRKPLILIQTKDVPGDLSLSKFGQPVEIRELSAAEGKPYLHLTDVKLSETAASVKLTYPIEGVGGEASLERQGDSWRVTKSEIWER